MLNELSNFSEHVSMPTEETGYWNRIMSSLMIWGYCCLHTKYIQIKTGLIRYRYPEILEIESWQQEKRQRVYEEQNWEKTQQLELRSAGPKSSNIQKNSRGCDSGPRIHLLGLISESEALQFILCHCSVA